MRGHKYSENYKFWKHIYCEKLSCHLNLFLVEIIIFKFYILFHIKLRRVLLLLLLIMFDFCLAIYVASNFPRSFNFPCFSYSCVKQYHVYYYMMLYYI